MIKHFRNKGLRELFETGDTRRINKIFHARLLVALDALDKAGAPEDMNVPGFQFHALKGYKPKRYTIHINGPWCVTFEFENGGARAVDFENYHEN